MTVSEHVYTAHAIVAPYITEPGYNMPTVPAEQVYSYGFENYAETVYPAGQGLYYNYGAGDTGWALTYRANGSGATGAAFGISSGGADPSRLFLQPIGGTTAVSPIPDARATRTLTGLIVGRTYNLTAVTMPWHVAGRTRLTLGTASTAWVGTATETAVSLSFVATATTAVLALEVEDNPADTAISTGSVGYFDTIVITGAAYTVVTAPGLDGWTGTVVTTTKRSGTRGLQAVSTTRTFTGLEVGRAYSLRGWRWNGTAWAQITSTFTATAASMARTLTATGATHWDDVTLTRDAYTTAVPPVYSTKRPVRVKGGTVSLDAGRAPHLQGTVEVFAPNIQTVDGLDPRLNCRLNLVCSVPGLTREFNLGVRSRDINQADNSLSLTLASDEALLDDYAPMVDDETPLSLQTSLRSIVNYVMGKALPGAALSAGPDVAVPALSESVNLMRNPRAQFAWDYQTEVATGGLTSGIYASGGPAYAPSYWYMTASANSTGAQHYYSESVLSISDGEDYVASVDVRSPAGQNLTVDAVIFDSSNKVIGFATPVIVNGNGAWQRKAVPFYAPATAAKVRTRVLVTGTMAAGKSLDVTAWRLSVDTGDPADITFFDGSTPPTALYTYSYASGVGVSNSQRRPLIDAATPESLIWRAGQSALDFLMPLVQMAGRRLVCDESRAWTLRNENYTAPGALSIRHAINMIDGDDTISRDSGIWYDAAAVVYTWNDSRGITQTVTDTYALTPAYTRLQTFERSTPYPGPGLAQYLVRRAQGRGREVTATSVSDWRANAEQPTTIVLENAPTQIGVSQAVTFDLNRDEMTVTTRTTDTLAGAIDLLAGTIDALTGTIDSI